MIRKGRCEAAGFGRNFFNVCEIEQVCRRFVVMFDTNKSDFESTIVGTDHVMI